MIVALAAAASIIVGDNVFLPGDTAVDRGTKVTWTWEGAHLHNLAVAKGPQRFRSRPRREGTFTRRMTRPGAYRLVCTIHTPEMRMTLTVRR